MAIKVLVVDDSSFFRRRLTEILTKEGDIELLDTAVNGQEAVEKALALKPDVITMDVEMPVLDGISAVRQIMQQQRIPILMFSSLTHDGAKATLDALDAGAVDFLPKKFEDIARDKDEAGQLLRDRVRAVARKRQLGRPTFSSALGNRTDPVKPALSTRPAMNAVGCWARAITPPAKNISARNARAALCLVIPTTTSRHNFPPQSESPSVTKPSRFRHSFDTYVTARRRGQAGQANVIPKIFRLFSRAARNVT